VLFQPNVYKKSSIKKIIVEKDPTVGRSPDLSIVLLLVLKVKVAFVLLALSKPPKIKIEDGPV